ncbi:leucyl aminopeptidase, partial [bacterium]|nr:leucyl aminopeptidase [bacterium]
FERVWPLPLVKEHHKLIESGIADLQNIGGRYGGACTAAAFLAEFVDDETPWAHLDIAGPAWVGKPGPLGPKGATGYGARLIARALEILTERDHG